MKKLLFILLLITLYCSLSAFTTIDNEVFLNILVDKGSTVNISTEGFYFVNGEEFNNSGFTISYINKNKFKFTSGRKTIKAKPHEINISVPGNFHIKGKTKQLFSGDIQLREYKDKIALMNIMNLESYTRYVVTSEIGSGAPLEALKAQAVVSRTYAIYMSMKNNRYPWDLRADTYSQVFNTKKTIPTQVIKATNSTEYTIMTYKGKVAFTPFNSYSGGFLADVEKVWGGKGFPYLDAMPDVPYLKKKDLSNLQAVKNWINKEPSKVYKHYSKLPNWITKSFKWKRTVSLNTVASKGKYSKIFSVKTLARSKSGRITKIQITTAKGKNIVTSQDKMRRIFGGIPSTLAIITKHGNSLVINGKGYGHGVGFCQSGAYLKAYAGQNYSQIVTNYYPGCITSSDYFFNPNEEDALDKLFGE